MRRVAVGRTDPDRLVSHERLEGRGAGRVISGRVVPVPVSTLSRVDCGRVHRIRWRGLLSGYSGFLVFSVMGRPANEPRRRFHNFEAHGEYVLSS